MIFYHENHFWLMLFFSHGSALQALNVTVDPIPKDVTQQFGLLELNDVSFFFCIIFL